MNAPGGIWRGAVLAGGQSRRMGTDKALLECDGEILWRRQARILREAGAAEVVVVRSPGQPSLDPGFPQVTDAVAGAGPLGGLQAALTAFTGGWIMVLAVDLPRIDAAWFQRLRGCCRPGAGAAMRGADGFEPLAAIYPAEALATVTEHLHQGEYRMQALAAALGRSGRLAIVPLPEADRRLAANWNHPGAIPG